MLQHAQFTVRADAEDRSIIQARPHSAACGGLQQVLPVEFVLGLSCLVVLGGGGNQSIDLARALSSGRRCAYGRQWRQQKAESSGNQTLQHVHGDSLSQSRPVLGLGELCQSPEESQRYGTLRVTYATHESVNAVERERSF